MRDVEPDRFVAALASRSGNHFRLYRLTMDPDGRFTVDEAADPTIKGSADGLAVSPEGRIAYAYSTAAGSFVGTLEREWPADGWGVQWLDEKTLAPRVTLSQVSGLATLDVAHRCGGERPGARARAGPARCWCFPTGGRCGRSAVEAGRSCCKRRGAAGEEAA